MLISGEIINAYGMTERLVGNITCEKVAKLAKKNCKKCYGRGCLNFDDGRVIVTEKAEYRLMNQYTVACDCVEKAMGLSPEPLRHSRHPASRRPIFTGKK